MLRFAWWLGFTLAGIWLQQGLAGVDFLAPGILLAVQQERPVVAAWLALCWMFVQEGTGGLAFGYGFAWYGGLFLFIVIGRWLFDQKSFLFACLTGLVLGAWHVALSMALGGLEELALSASHLAVEGVMQALLFPLTWWAAHSWYPERLKRHERPA